MKEICFVNDDGTELPFSEAPVRYLHEVVAGACDFESYPGTESSVSDEYDMDIQKRYAAILLAERST